MRDEVGFQLVTPGDVPALMDTYRKARAAGEHLAAALTRAGIGLSMAVVVPAISAAGVPVVHVTFTAAGAARLSRCLDGGGAPPGGAGGGRPAGGPGDPQAA